MSYRILVLSASVGAGHLRAAQAVELALRQLRPDATVRNIDVLQLTNAAFRRLYGQAYLDLVNKAPHLLGYIYDMMDKPVSSLRRRDKLRIAFEKLNFKPFVELLTGESWDLAINTHFLPAEIIASLRQRGKVAIPQAIVTTDFDVHRLWVNQPADRYFTATEEGALVLAAWGVPAADIRVTGIPIHPFFSQDKSSQECRLRHGMPSDRPVVLQLAGGFGVGPIAQIHRALLDAQRPLHVVVVTGRNQEAQRELAGVACPSRHQRTILGFTDQMDELLAAADLVLSKPGGLTTSEALARGAAMVIIDPIPGQESRNSDYLLENSAAIKINGLATLPHKLDRLLSDPDRLAALRGNARRLGHPRSAFDVAAGALELVR